LCLLKVLVKRESLLATMPSQSMEIRTINHTPLPVSVVPERFDGFFLYLVGACYCNILSYSQEMSCPVVSSEPTG
jgi:hypothetical protein